MTLQMIAELLREHPWWAVLGAFVLGTVTIKKMELPVWGWARDWINTRLDGFGQRLNASTAAQLSAMQEQMRRMQTQLDEVQAHQQQHEAVSDRRRADDHRQSILHYNLEIMAGMAHDRESYVEILSVVDRYLRYCKEHPEYINSRADAAIRNIRRMYDIKLKCGFEPKED